MTRSRIHIKNWISFFTSFDVKLYNSVVSICCCDCWIVSSSLFSHDMNQNRAYTVGVLHLSQNINQVSNVVSIYRADVVKAKLFEQSRPLASGDETTGILIDLSLEKQSGTHSSRFDFILLVPELIMHIRKCRSSTLAVRSAISGPSCLVTPLAISLSSRSGLFDWSRPSIPDSAPTGCVGPSRVAVGRLT